jgi:hypothetical protein
MLLPHRLERPKLMVQAPPLKFGRVTAAGSGRTVAAFPTALHQKWSLPIRDPCAQKKVG